MKISAEIAKYRTESGEPCEVEIVFDQEGLDYLLKRLSKLKEAGDHIHMMTPSWGMDELVEEKQDEANALVHHVRF